MTTELWKSAPFFIATKEGVVSREGKIYNGLGYDLRQPVGTSLAVDSIWAVTHLGTGHAICHIEGTEPEIAVIATEFAQAGNWNFASLDGWKNVDPDLLEKIKTILKKHHVSVFRYGTGTLEEAAQQIAEARG
jgi:hypothetical protein